MSIEREIQLVDQPVDPMARFYAPTADAYDHYLQSGPWARNQTKFERDWQRHYDNIDTRLTLRLLEEEKARGLRIKEMNLMLVGPGFEPVGNDISQKVVDLFWKRLRRIIVVDFSMNVVRSSIRDLVHAGVEPTRIYGKQCDLTIGVSSAFRAKVQSLLDGVQNEEGFCTVVRDQFPKIQHEELMASAMQTAVEGQILTGSAERVLSESSYTERAPVRIDGNSLPIHLALFPMVLAGTNAPAEAEIWDRWDEVTSDADRGARPLAPDVTADHEQVYRLIHETIARINTAIAYIACRDTIAATNAPGEPPPTVIAPTDVSTDFEEPNYGTMDRINVSEFARRLSLDGIRADAPILHRWDEDDRHSHGVHEIICRRR